MVFELSLPTKSTDIKRWGGLIASSAGLALAEAVQNYHGLLVVLVPDFTSTFKLEHELKAFLPLELHSAVYNFPDWETLPYDSFSPHQDIISQRLTILYQLANKSHGILLVPVTTALHRLCPSDYIVQNTVVFAEKESINLELLRYRLEAAGYLYVNQVREHGEFTVRGSLIDLFPMGAKLPYRLDLFDNEIDSIRSFDPETQRSIDKVANIKLLPAKEFPTHEQAISMFRNRWRAEFSGDPRNCSVYQEVSKGFFVPGLEYYIPLFFENCATLFDYLPQQSVIVRYGDIAGAAQEFWMELGKRYEQYCHDITHPILKPNKLFLAVDELFQYTNKLPQILLQQELFPMEGVNTGKSNFPVVALPDISLNPTGELAFNKIQHLLEQKNIRILLCAESLGRKTILYDLFVKNGMQPVEVSSWQQFLSTDQRLSIAVLSIEAGLCLTNLNVVIITEFDIFGNKVMQRRRRKIKTLDPSVIIHDLAEIDLGTPVVHIEHGVGRFVGLQKIAHDGHEQEFVVLNYADNDKLYVPVSSLHLISRYSGVDLEHAPLHALGNNKWQKDRRKALEQVRDVAAELLAIYAKRELRSGSAFPAPDGQYATFALKFPFEETPDQEQAITQVIADLVSTKPMDRVICGDVGFGKTEVAMRAAFLTVRAGKQVAILVPTTLLAQQHYQTFIDRFADFPINIEVMSRFKTKREQHNIEMALAAGKCDIVIGTHRLLQSDIKFNNLGLLVIDEEHRFGVRQKERFKALRSEVNILTMTATPIPRTLNMALSKLRDLSIIGTPPAKRLSIKTFVREYNKPLIQEAILRELRRGGQVYYLHNEVNTIEKRALEVQELIPTARIAIAHGQMPERDLERVMADFYHRRSNILICTTIIETGIDVPTANTIIIERADKLGLAQLHQLRGRVGRSHHQAYAFCLTPPPSVMTADAVKRLEAISSLETLGSGFTLATYDLEIRGAGELLGEEQSGNMQVVGFNLYMELLDYAVKTLQAGKELDLNLTLPKGIEIDLMIPALIPNNYINDIHTRLVQYKSIAMAKDMHKLEELQVAMIDRFGVLPDQTKNLFIIAGLKLRCEQLGIIKIKIGLKSGVIDFNNQPNIDPGIIIDLLHKDPACYKLNGPNSIKFLQNFATAENRISLVNILIEKFMRFH